MMRCEVIRDLLPLYLDGVCSEETKKIVEEHLAECGECQEYMQQLQTDLNMGKESVKDLDEKKLLQEGVEHMKAIGKRNIVDKLIIVDTLLNLLLIVAAIISCKRMINAESDSAFAFVGAMIFTFGFVIIFFVCDCITLIQKWKRKKMQGEYEYTHIPICESYAKVSIGIKVVLIFTAIIGACVLGMPQLRGYMDLFIF